LALQATVKIINKLEEKPMTTEPKKVVPQTDPSEAEPGRGAPGDQWAVQTAQTTAVNPPDAVIPSGANPEKSIKEVEALEEQEEGSGMTTTDGYVIDESGRLDNFAIEPEMYVEEK
jgi:hypothetical protein